MPMICDVFLAKDTQQRSALTMGASYLKAFNSLKIEEIRGVLKILSVPVVVAGTAYLSFLEFFSGSLSYNHLFAVYNCFLICSSIMYISRRSYHRR